MSARARRSIAAVVPAPLSAAEQPGEGPPEILHVSTCTQAPVRGSQLSSVQLLPSSQSLGTPTQVPASHVSRTVHGSALLQATPVSGTCTQAPVVGSQLSAVQLLPSLHDLGVPVHTPARQVSPVVHACWSSQATASSGACTQAPVRPSQLSAVHGLPSSQLAPKFLCI